MFWYQDNIFFQILAANYLILDARRLPLKAVSALVSPLFRLDADTSMSFKVYMERPLNVAPPSLSVRSVYLGMLEETLLEVESANGAMWLNYTICVPHWVTQLAFVGHLGDSSEASIAVDDVQLLGRCLADLGENTTGESNAFLTYHIKLGWCLK